MNTKGITHMALGGGAGLFFLLVASSWAAQTQSLSGHVLPVTAKSQLVGPVPASRTLNLAIALPLRNQDELSTLLEQLYDPASPQYRRFLTPEQFAERFGPTKEDYATIIEFAKSHGFAVTQTHPNRTLLDISGTVEDIEKVFQVSLKLYQHPTEHRVYHAPDREPSVELAVPILHIHGLDNFFVPRPLSHKKEWNGNRNPLQLEGSGPGGAFLASDFRAAYVPGVALTGAGESVALVEFDGYYPSDVADYLALNGLPNVPLRNVILSGGGGPPGASNFEVAMDIEVAIAMAPGLSEVIVYEGGNSDFDNLNRIATDNAARQISCSWTMGFGPTLDQVLQQFAAQGQSFMQASGDWGAGGWIADDPYITTVGGTQLSMSGSGGAWASEIAWNAGYDFSSGQFIATGGGISTAYALPAWQQGLATATNRASTIWRNVPDVAMVADNIWIVADDGYASTAYGTSAAAPLWAGFVALANQLAAAHGHPPVGFINPAVYSLGKSANYSACFRDIITGDTSNRVDHTGFPAVPGYDLCTGWGTPAGSNLLYALALPHLLQIAPGTNVISSGIVGGPFNPAMQAYSLTNVSAVTMDWTLGYNASWLDASATNGTLTPGAAAATVTLSVNTQASSLPVGSYPASLWFTNLIDGSVQTRLFTLAVMGSPVVISGPTNETVPEGGTAIFTIVTATNGLLNYSWDRFGPPLTDDGRISGSATSTLIISNVSAADAGNYRVFVSNPVGLSGYVCELLTIPSSPIIIQPPANQTVLPGATAAFAVGAVGTQPLSYQWFRNGTNLISGATTSVLTVRNVGPAVTGTYSVVVSNSLDSVTSVGAVLAVIPVTEPGVTLTTLYSFTAANDGANPNGLVLATNGLLYGTANSAGTYGNGTVFRITTNGTLTTMRQFTGASDGATPKARLIQATDGNLYGTTRYGGTYGNGTIFRISLAGGFAALHQSTGGSDGNPVAGLIQAGDGNFYGAGGGGPSGNGVVFKMATNGAFTSLHSFNGADGSGPPAPPVQGPDGNLYGITSSGGLGPFGGTVFQMTLAGALTTLFEFQITNGSIPRGALLLHKDGSFYGTTVLGGTYACGTAFKITADGQFTMLHSFHGLMDGSGPRAAVAEGRDGYLYGSTSQGGTYNLGTLFRMSPTGLLTTLVHFDGFNGATPRGPLVQAADGSFYGTTLNGGVNNAGTVFRLTVPAPTLLIGLSADELILSWPAWAADLALQQNSDLTTGNWTTVTNSPVVTNQQNQVTLSPPPSGNMFYRLTH